MNFKVMYNGVDITNKISLETCRLADRFGGMLDSIYIAFSNKEDWSNYGVQKNDEIVIATDDYSTGKMYIDECKLNSKTYIVNAISLKPTNKKRKSRVWRDVRLSEVLKDVSVNCGLELKMYGIQDKSYASLSQKDETDLRFLQTLCEREGCSIKIDDDCLIVFNEYYIENSQEAETLTSNEVYDNYSFADSGKGVSEVVVSYYDIEKGLISYIAKDDSVTGGTINITTMVSNIDEAQRYAYGYLRKHNKDRIVGKLSMKYNPTISAGTVINAEGFNEFDGKYIVSEVIHDVIAEKTSITIRKTLSY